MNSFAEKIITWHDTFGRKNLPWQQDLSPYKVWVSEIMLQQTQVTTVIPYFERFISAFPTVEQLANAELDFVLHFWSGLGYYARARNLHRTAKIICEQFNHHFPNNIEDLVQLPGIGRSTAGAILSIAFQQRAPILDGNVKRVLTRYHAVSGHPGEKKVENQLWELADQHTPQHHSATYTQAIMDIGATLCTRSNPTCLICPLEHSCSAFLQKRVAEFPTKKPKNTLPIRNTCMLILLNQQKHIYLEKRPSMGIWGGLWSFPECKEGMLDQYCQKNQLNLATATKLSTFRHTFSHFHLDITPILVTVFVQTMKVTENDSLWCSLQHLPAIGLAAPINKILQSNIIQSIIHQS